MAFNPKDFGFEPISTKHGSRIIRNYCYLRYGLNGKKTSGDTRNAIVLALDEETTDCARELFGATVGISINDKGQIVLYEGKDRRLSANRASVKAQISLYTECEKLCAILGEFTIYRYESKIYAKGEAILLTPVEKVE